VDRFFSKLDLRDIKIDPFKTSFPPDADEDQPEEDEPTPATSGIETESARPPANEVETAPPTHHQDARVTFQPAPELPDRRPHAPAWATAIPEADPAPAAHNGHVVGHIATSTLVHTESVVELDLDTARDPDLYEDQDDVVAVAPAVVGRESHSGEVLKVSARSRPSAVAGAIAGVVREAGRAEVQAIGAGATNQAVKAVAIARDYLRETGIEAICLPAFIDVTIDNEDRTAIRLVVEPR
jgi:stage V sporulation protein S